MEVNMPNMNSMVKNYNFLTNDELAALCGGDVITGACVVFGTAVYMSGGSLLANPVGAGVAGFCIGYSVGRLLANFF
jgi:hypothetical protein